MHHINRLPRHSITIVQDSSDSQYLEHVSCYVRSYHSIKRSFTCILSCLILLLFNVSVFAEPFPTKFPGKLSVANPIYYVKPDGNDNLDGRSDANAWRTISKVNSYSFVPGSDVYFKCGGVWTEQLLIRWSGRSDERATIGAYYVEGGRVKHGVNGSKPIIDGQDIIPSKESHTGLIHVYNQSYVTIVDMKVVNSECYGVSVEEGSDNQVINLDTDNIYNAGIRYKDVVTGVITGCDVTNSCRTQFETGGDWPAGISIVNSDNINVRNNTVHENYGEGIVVGTFSNNCIVESNILFANIKVQIYIDRSRGNIVRRNLVYGTTDSTFHRSDWGPGLGIGIADESWDRPYSENNEIYDNRLAYLSYGIFLWGGYHEASQTGSRIKDTHVYDNIIVDCSVNFLTNFDSRIQYPYANSTVRKNVSWCISGDCTHASVPTGHLGLTFDENLWSSSPDKDAQGPNDPPYQPPQLSKTSGWRSLTGGDLAFEDF